MVTPKYNRPPLSRLLVLLGLSVLLVLSSASPAQSEEQQSFTLIVLPDTQFYADVRGNRVQKKFGIPDQRFCFYAQTQWIKDMRKKLNIAMTIHLGDIVQRDDPREWEIADRAFETIDHFVPYILSQGNHDMGCEKPSGSAHSRLSKMDDYFPPSRFKNNPLYNYGGNLNDSSRNYFLEFNEAGMQFLVISLEFKPRDKALAWANKVISSHPDHRCIVVTHAYLTGREKRFAKLSYKVDGNSGEEVWNKLISQHENIFMVLCGHTRPKLNSKLIDRGVNGNKVYQLLSDYQHEKGGQGYLRIMKFLPEQNKIDVSSYSPVLNHYKRDAKNQFSLKYAMNPTETNKLDVEMAQ